MDPEYANSDRAELCGLLAIVAQLLELSRNAERWLNGEEKKKVYIYTDSASSITLIEKKIHSSTKNVMLSNLDVILEVQQILNKLPFHVKLVHVKAHQDENCSYKELSIPARLNYDMDKYAAKQYKYSLNDHLILMPHLPAQQISFKNRYFRLTNRMDIELARIRRDYSEKIAALKSWNINKEDAHKIHWGAIDTAVSRWGKYRRGGVLKCIHRWWDTSERKKRWGQADSNNCPLCNLAVETPDHVLKCKHDEMRKVRNQLMNDVKNKIKSCGTCPLLHRWIMILLNQWIGNFPISHPTTECTVKIKEAILEQERLGIGNMLRGILSTKWGEIQKKSKELNETNVTDTWSGEIAHTLLSFSCQMWKIRCQYIHLMKNGTSESEYRKKMETKCEKMKINSLQLMKCDRHLVNRKKKFFCQEM